jgi:hypothetical protein
MYMLERHYDELTKGLPDRTQLQAVNITNAATWFFDDTKNVIVEPLMLETPHKVMAWKWDGDFPAVIPPFPVMWMEYKIPKWITDIGDSDDTFSEVSVNVDTMGCLIRANPLLDEDGWLITWESWQMLNARTERRYRLTVEKYGANGWFNDWEGALKPWWKMTAKCNRAGEIIQDSILYEFEDEDGEPYVETEKTIEQRRRDTNESEHWFYGYEIWGTFHPVLFATSLMHAKNVHLVDRPLPPAVAKRRQREGKPVVTFKTLTIESMRKQTATATEGGSTGAKRAMHIVRGHFKDYRNTGGLFGKHKGLYWWDMRVAGDENAGKVIKDYKI